MKQERRELYNLRCEENQEQFFNLTNNTTKLTECFESEESVIEQTKKWSAELEKFIKKCFKKVRIVTNNKKSDLNILLEKRCKLKKKLAN